MNTILSGLSESQKEKVGQFTSTNDMWDKFIDIYEIGIGKEEPLKNEVDFKDSKNIKEKVHTSSDNCDDYTEEAHYMKIGMLSFNSSNCDKI